jgi:hypothetical protein
MKIFYFGLFFLAGSLTSQVPYRVPTYHGNGFSAEQSAVWWVNDGYGTAFVANQVEEALEYAFRTDRGISMYPTRSEWDIKNWMPNTSDPQQFANWWNDAQSGGFGSLWDNHASVYDDWYLESYTAVSPQPQSTYTAQWGSPESGGIILAEGQLEHMGSTGYSGKMLMFSDFDWLDSDEDGLLDKWGHPWSEPVRLEDLPSSPGDLDGDGLDFAAELAGGHHPLWSDADVDLYVDAMLGDDLTYTGRGALPNIPSAGDGPKRSLSAAFSEAGSGEILLIQPGDYNETSLTLDGKDLTLRPNGEGVRLF